MHDSFGSGFCTKLLDQMFEEVCTVCVCIGNQNQARPPAVPDGWPPGCEVVSFYSGDRQQQKSTAPGCSTANGQQVEEQTVEVK